MSTVQLPSFFKRTIWFYFDTWLLAPLSFGVLITEYAATSEVDWKWILLTIASVALYPFFTRLMSYDITTQYFGDMSRLTRKSWFVPALNKTIDLNNCAFFEKQYGEPQYLHLFDQNRNILISLPTGQFDFRSIETWTERNLDKLPGDAA